MKFTDRLARLEPIVATLEKPTAVTKTATLVEPRFVSINGRGVGLLDEVAAQLMRQGLGSNRLLVAINDQLLEVAIADLNTVLDTTGAHIKQSYDALEIAQDAHERVALRNPEAKS